MKIVVKFGGSSLASAEQFKKVADIIHADPHRRFVVPSAPGKRFDGDTKVTDMLYGCYDLAEAGKDFDGALADIKARYDEIIEGLGLDLTLDKEFETIHEQFRLKAGRNYAASRGEYLNGIVLANYLGFEFIDAATVIRFDDAGNFEADRTDLILSSRLKDVEYAVVPGFYGAQDDGVVTTFSRGGSDITGSIVAKAVHADVYENWTDVSGFLVADGSMLTAYNESFEKYNIEDGHFTVIKQMNKAQKKNVEALGVTLYDLFYVEETLVTNDSTLRIFPDRFDPARRSRRPDG